MATVGRGFVNGPVFRGTPGSGDCAQDRSGAAWGGEKRNHGCSLRPWGGTTAHMR